MQGSPLRISIFSTTGTYQYKSIAAVLEISCSNGLVEPSSRAFLYNHPIGEQLLRRAVHSGDDKHRLYSILSLDFFLQFVLP